MSEVAARLRQRRATVAVVGMGRVGLPLSIALASAGLRAIGLERNADYRQAIEKGLMPFCDETLEKPLAEVVAAGRLTVRGEVEQVVPGADVVVLCVATPLTADLRADDGDLLEALTQMAPHLRPGQLIVLRSTVAPGTLLKVVRPFLRVRAPGVADTLLLASCPERIAEGRALQELASLPEIIGAPDEQSAEAACELFRVLNADKRLHVTDPTSAEMTKLINNVYRYVNFALANEFAILAEYYGADIREILTMANEAYPRAGIPRPGPAGGPCLSKDGYFLVGDLTLPDFVLMAWKLNDSIPAYVIRRLKTLLAGQGVSVADLPVAVLGRTFKRDSSDLRQSPAERICRILEREGARVQVHEPSMPGLSLEEALRGAGAFVVATNHSVYDDLDPFWVSSLMTVPKIGFDCWGVLDTQAFRAAGVMLMTFGVGDGS